MTFVAAQIIWANTQNAERESLQIWTFFSIFLVKSNKYVVQNYRNFTNFYVFLIFAIFFVKSKSSTAKDN